MKKNKINWTFFILAFCLFSCSQSSGQEKYLLLSGNITNCTESQIKLTTPGVEYNAPIENGRFNFKVPVEGQIKLYSLLVGEMEVPVYLLPNEELNLSLEMKEESLDAKFEGKTKPESKYFWDVTQINDYESMDNRVKSDNLSLFLERHNAYYDTKESKLTLPENADPEFYELASALNKFRRGEEMLYFAMTNKQQGKDDVPEDYYSFMETLNYDNAKWLQLPNFSSFIHAHLYSTNSGQPDGIFNLILEVITDKTLMEYLCYSHLDQSIYYDGVGSVKEELEQFKSICNNDFYHEALNKTIKESKKKFEKLKEGTTAPEMIAVNSSGEKINLLSRFKGKVLYIDLWATWCAPCLKELPYLNEIKEKYKNDPNFKIIGISLDKDIEKWKTFLKKEKLKGTQLNVENAFESQLSKDYIVEGIPRFILIDHKGRLAMSKAPRPSEKDQLTEAINNLLADANSK